MKVGPDRVRGIGDVPHSGHVVRHTSISGIALTVGIVAPLVIYCGLRAAGVALYPAVLAAAVAPGLGTVFSVLRFRRVEPLAALSLTGLALAVLMSLAGGGPRLLLAKEGWLTAITGIWFPSACAARGRWRSSSLNPPAGHFGFSSDGDAVWEPQPRFRRIWRISSVLRGLGTLADSAVRVVIAYTLPVDAVPTVARRCTSRRRRC